MNKLWIYFIGVFVLFGLVIGSTLIIATNLNDDLLKEKTLTTCQDSKDVNKCLKKVDTILSDYNNNLHKNITIDKVKVLKEEKIKDLKKDDNPLELTLVEIDGKQLTVISAH